MHFIVGFNVYRLFAALHCMGSPRNEKTRLLFRQVHRIAEQNTFFLYYVLADFGDGFSDRAEKYISLPRELYAALLREKSV